MDFYFIISKLLTPIIKISNFLVLVLIISFYYGILNNKKIFKKIFVTIFITFATLSIFPIGKALLYFFLEKDFYKQDIPNNIDYIFVPAGSYERLISAINIKNKHELKDIKILYSTGNPYLDKKNTTNQEKLVVDAIIKNAKINYSDIVFLPEARNTLENFKRLNEYLKEINNINSKILIVTQAFHLKRCLIIAKKYNLNTVGYASFYYTKRYSKGFINGYQKLCVTCNLRILDLFVRESLSLTFSKLSSIKDQ